MIRPCSSNSPAVTTTIPAATGQESAQGVEQRSQSRTVLTGRPNPAATRRWPAPRLGHQRRPITATPSAGGPASRPAAAHACTVTASTRTDEDAPAPPRPRPAHHAHGRDRTEETARRSPDNEARRRSTTGRPRAGPHLPSTTGASKHQATALPSGQGMGRAAALSPTSSRSRHQRRRATRRAALKIVVTTNDAVPTNYPPVVSERDA
jgi:hypothetical protein